jgi:hypothetical protein
MQLRGALCVMASRVLHTLSPQAFMLLDLRLTSVKHLHPPAQLLVRVALVVQGVGCGPAQPAARSASPAPISSALRADAPCTLSGATDAPCKASRIGRPTEEERLCRGARAVPAASEYCLIGVSLAPGAARLAGRQVERVLQRRLCAAKGTCQAS